MLCSKIGWDWPILVLEKVENLKGNYTVLKGGRTAKHTERRSITGDQKKSHVRSSAGERTSGRLPLLRSPELRTCDFLEGPKSFRKKNIYYYIIYYILISMVDVSLSSNYVSFFSHFCQSLLFVSFGFVWISGGGCLQTFYYLISILSFLIDVLTSMYSISRM